MKTLFRFSLLVSFVYLTAACSGGAASKIEDDGTANENNQVQQQNQQFQQDNQAAPTANGNSEVAVNPPHGQPGHDCAIPVGAPLNSTAQDGSQDGAQPEGMPIEFNTGDDAGQTQNTESDGSVAVNPPHGEPGHDCAVPVGAPLEK